MLETVQSAMFLVPRVLQTFSLRRLFQWTVQIQFLLHEELEAVIVRT